MVDFMAQLLDAVERARAAGWTQAQIAEAAGCSREELSRACSGSRRTHALAHWSRVATEAERLSVTPPLRCCICGRLYPLDADGACTYCQSSRQSSLEV